MYLYFFKKIFSLLKLTFKNFDKKIRRILKFGLMFCLFIAIISVTILAIYLFYLHSPLIYQIGIMVFEISLYYAIFFIASAITVDSIIKTHI